MKASILSLMFLFSWISCVYNTGTSVIARILTVVFFLLSQHNYLWKHQWDCVFLWKLSFFWKWGYLIILQPWQKDFLFSPLYVLNPHVHVTPRFAAFISSYHFQFNDNRELESFCFLRHCWYFSFSFFVSISTHTLLGPNTNYVSHINESKRPHSLL